MKKFLLILIFFFTTKHTKDKVIPIENSPEPIRELTAIYIPLSDFSAAIKAANISGAPFPNESKVTP